MLSPQRVKLAHPHHVGYDDLLTDQPTLVTKTTTLYDVSTISLNEVVYILAENISILKLCVHIFSVIHC